MVPAMAMRIRTVKPEFFLHEGLFELEKETGMPLRVAFAGLWCVADREGRFKWESRKIGVQVLPYDLIDFSRVLDALTTRGFILKYAVDSVEYGWIPSFVRHQVINNRERPSELPEPSEINICDASTTRQPRVGHAGKAEGKGMEGNKEGNKKEDILSLLPEEETPKPAPINPLQVRIGKLLGRRPTTKWSTEELKLLKGLGQIEESDLKLMEEFYAAAIPKADDYRRTTIDRILKHWSGEVDKARLYRASSRASA